MIPIIKPCLGEPEAAAARRAILSGWTTQGPEVAAFEAEFAAFTGAPHACAVANCTAALHLALLAAGVGPGDEVITVSHSFIATANSIRYTGALPVFVDIDPASYNIDPLLVERALTSRTRAILCVHQMGLPCDLHALAGMARTRGIPLIEDAACAIGSQIQGKDGWELIGKPHGDAACFSFHPRKLISTGDGGMITTRLASWDAHLRRLRQHGMSVSDRQRHSSAQVIFEQYADLGFNYRMTDIQAAVGREQLKRLPDIVAQRRSLAALYAQQLASIPGLVVPHEPEWARTNWQSYCVRLPEGVDQRATMQALLEQGIATRRGVMCAHREAPYRQAGSWRAAGPLTASEAAQDTAIMLPLYHDLAPEQIAAICAALHAAVSAECAA